VADRDRETAADGEDRYVGEDERGDGAEEDRPEGPARRFDPRGLVGL
jgi:hypothetical protein